MRRDLNVAIRSIATAVPRYKVDQDEILETAVKAMPRFRSMIKIFENSGVKTRYSCVPMSWYSNPRGWKSNNDAYLENALDLVEEAATRALDRAGVSPEEVASIVSVSSSGLAIPSLDARLANRMNLNQCAERLPIFGLGCAGGASGLGRAARLAHSIGDGPVLLLVVEIAGLNVHVNERNMSLFVSTALFGDGAVALLLDAKGEEGAKTANALPRVRACGEFQWRDTEDVMGWRIEERGLDVILSPYIPEFTQEKFRPQLEAFLARNRLVMEDLDGFVFHPGGRKVLDAIESCLALDKSHLRHSEDILRDYGNMSAPTVLFILERTVQSGASGLHLLASFGPGFTTTFVLLDL